VARGGGTPARGSVLPETDVVEGRDTGGAAEKLDANLRHPGQRLECRHVAERRQDGPGRRELLEALYTEEVDAICDAAEAVAGETPGAALNAWLRRFVAFSTGKRHIASELLTHVDSSNPMFNENRDRVLAAGPDARERQP